MPIVFTTDIPEITSLSFDSNAENSLTISWSTELNNGSYRIQIRDEGETSWDSSASGWHEEVVSYTTEEITVTGLEEGQTFEIRARTETEDVAGQWYNDTTIIPPFDIEITNIEDVLEGRPAKVFFTAKNLGEYEATRSIEFLVDGVQRDSTSLTLSSQETTSLALQWADTIPGEYHAEVTSPADRDYERLVVYDDNTLSGISVDWSEISLDSPSVDDSYSPYSARLFPRDGVDKESPLELDVDSISYTQQVSSAKDLSADIPPTSELHGTQYIGGVMDVFVGDELLYSGDIEKINTNQNENEFYTVDVRNPGKKLKDGTVRDTTDNYILRDYAAKIVDKYNSWDDEHFALTETSQESLSGIEKPDNRVRVSTTDGATATYSNVGSDASDIEVIHVKIDTVTSSKSVTVTVNDGSNTYQETLTGRNGGTYGEWIEIRPTGLNSTSYDIQFSLDSETVLYDWISLLGDELTREVEPASSPQKQTKEQVQSANDNTSFNNNSSVPADKSVAVRNGNVEMLQTCFYGVDENELSIPSTNFPYKNTSISYYSSNISETDGTFYEFDSTGQYIEFTFVNEYDWPSGDWEIILRHGYPDDGDGVSEPMQVPGFDVSIDGTTHFSASDGATFSEGINWFKINGNNPLSSGSHTVRLEITSNDSTENDVYRLDALGARDARFNYTDASTTDAGHGLLGPGYYPQISNPSRLEFNSVVLGSNITKGYIEVGGVNDSNGLAELALSFNPNTSFFTTPDATTFEYGNPSTTSTITGRVGLSGYSPNGTRYGKCPKENYEPQEFSSYNLYVDLELLDILYGEDINGNRLKVLTDLIDDSLEFYRWEGNTCRIFSRGSRKTNPNLREESITSSIGITDVFSSCEVIGRNGVTSGVITSENAPNFIDRHKEIRDSDIENEQDAKRKANTFLANHSDIEYTGDISTLPTLAPVGEEVDGSMFNHGQDMYIEKVRYSKRGSDITLGRQTDITDQILKLDRETSSVKKNQTTQ